jgi:lysophospholipase L1-like esterase
MKKRLLSLLLAIFIFLAAWELCSAVLAHLGFIHRDLPTYSWKQVSKRFWSETNPVFGVWHPANTSFEHRRSCFDVRYHSNQHGMRDAPRIKKSVEPRVVFLGDSFVEGWGVEAEDRFTNLLEKFRKRPHLNFGVAGYFGPNQYALLYESLAKEFDHDEIMVGIYPENDFTDDNFEYWKATGRWKGWYKPFLVGRYPHYREVYTEARPRGADLPLSRQFVRTLREFSYGYAALAQINKLFHRAVYPQGNTPEGKEYAGYYDFTKEDWNRLKFSLDRIRGAATGKKISLILFPHASDLKRFQETRTQAPLSKKLSHWAQENQVTLIDLLPPFASDPGGWNQFYQLPCDPHLSPIGHQKVAREILGGI